MAIYIKGINAPKDCETCDILKDCNLWTLVDVGEKHPDCPMVEVKEPHGRLIDADALKQTLIPMWNCNSDSDFANKCVWHAMEDAPTVIERSKDERRRR